eukprot:jgi/Ulvmu1/6958/UM033_0015.1
MSGEDCQVNCMQPHSGQVHRASLQTASDTSDIAPSLPPSTPLYNTELTSEGGTRTVPAFFASPFDLPDVKLRCDDNVCLLAHRHVLASRCKYYSDKWSKKQTVGLLNIDKTPVIKEYGFRGSSACCRGMLQFFYLGYIIELEDAVVSMDDYYPHISSLLEFSLIRGRDGLGGLADYLINLLCQKGLMDASAALQRLDLAVKVAASVGPDVRVQKLIDAMMATLPNLTFTLDSFSRGCVDPDTVLQVLRDVPLPADEVDVCRSLSKWAEAYEADEDSAADPDAFIDVDDDILKHIDLLFVSLQDIKEVLPYLHIFSADALTDAKRKHVLALNRDPFLYMSMGFRNTSRGRDIASGTTTVYPPAQSAGNVGMQSPLRRTNGHAPRSHGTWPGTAPPPSHPRGRGRSGRTDSGLHDRNVASSDNITP